ncbi:MAG: DnaA/Hda family protein [Eggerthellaceae bacterium]|nr:DnaA/Hda family protein [Eggerthellaceae bacterium]
MAIADALELNPVDALLVFDGNRGAFERVIGITQAEDEGPIQIFISGPSGSGKTALLTARSSQKDLLSRKHVDCYHTGEFVIAVNNENIPDSFFENLGKVDILLLDGFSELIGADEQAELLAKLMIAERKRQKLTTIIVSQKPLEELDISSFDGAFDDFEIYTIEPLDAAARVEYVKKIQDMLREKDVTLPKLDDEAVCYLANDFSENLKDVRTAVRYFINGAGYEPGTIVDLDTAKKALGR